MSTKPGHMSTDEITTEALRKFFEEGGGFIEHAYTPEYALHFYDEWSATGASMHQDKPGPCEHDGDCECGNLTDKSMAELREMYEAIMPDLRKTAITVHLGSLAEIETFLAGDADESNTVWCDFAGNPLELSGYTEDALCDGLSHRDWFCPSLGVWVGGDDVTADMLEAERIRNDGTLELVSYEDK